MRFIWSIVFGLTLVAAGFGLGKWINADPDPPRLPRNPSALDWLIAGYVEIPAATPQSQCTGSPSGMIRIRLSNILKNLNESKTVERDIDFIDSNITRDEDTPPTTDRPDRVKSFKGFPTNLDFKTVSIRKGRLVSPNSYVVVRVILDKTAGSNDSVEFLHQAATTAEMAANPAVATARAADSRFAVLRSYGTNRKMFCGRQPIVREGIEGRSVDYVDFGVQSTGQPETGSFGIGLLVRDSNEPYVTPIILDPHVKNEG